MSEDLLAAILRGTPSLPGAACKQLSHLFDAGEPEESGDRLERRHHAAKQLCSSCIELEPCSRWLNSLPRSQRPTGVIAGQVFDHSKKRGRPRKQAS